MIGTAIVIWGRGSSRLRAALALGSGAAPDLHPQWPTPPDPFLT